MYISSFYRKKSMIKRMIVIALMLTLVLLYGCSSTITVDYENEESFEAALNEGQDLEGKTVKFVVRQIEPQSAFGYNIIAGEHLNFVSSRNPNVSVGDIVTVKVTEVRSLLGSWILEYKKLDVQKAK